ncbi:ribonuclease H-like domain-containing protein [Tanacetum coccineum]
MDYSIKSNAEVLSYEEEMDRGIFASIRETDPGYHDIPLYSRFKQVEYKGVPHPLSGDYTPREQEDIDDSLYEYGKYGPQPQSPSPTVSNASSISFSICPSNDSDGDLGTVSVNDDPVSTQKTQPKVPTPTQTVDPSCAQHVKPPRQPIRTPVTSSPIPLNNRQNWNQRMQRDLGAGFSFERKPCFVCGSLSHLIKNCDYYEKKMAREAALKSKRVVHTNDRQATPAWNNTNRINKANQFTPRHVNVRPNLSTASNTIKTGRVNVNAGHGNVNSGSVHVNAGTQVKSGISRFNTGKQHVNSGSVYVNTGTQVKSGASRVNTGKRYINSGCVHINTARVNRPVSNKPSPKPSQVKFNGQNKYFSKQSSPANRPFSRNTAYKSNIYAVKGKMGTAVKTSAGCVWRKTTPLFNTNSGPIPDSYVHVYQGPQGRPKPMKAWDVSWAHDWYRPILRLSKNSLEVGIFTFGEVKGVSVVKGKATQGSCKAKMDRYVPPNPTLHMDNIDPTSVRISTSKFMSSDYYDCSSHILGDPNTPVSELEALSRKSLRAHASKKVTEALEDGSWIEACKRTLCSQASTKTRRIEGESLQKQSTAVVKFIDKEEGIEYDEVYAPVARIEANQVFLAFASFNGFIVYKWMSRVAFCDGTIEEESPIYTQAEQRRHLHISGQVAAEISRSLTCEFPKAAITPKEDQVAFRQRMRKLLINAKDFSSQCCQEGSFKYLKGQTQLRINGYPRTRPLIWKHFSDSDYGVPTLTGNPQQVNLNQWLLQQRFNSHVPIPSSSHVQITQPQSPPPPITATPPTQSPPPPITATPPTQPPPSLTQPVQPPPTINQSSSTPPQPSSVQPTLPPSPQVPSPSYHDTEGPSFEPSYHLSPPPSHEPENQAFRSSEENEQLRNLMDIVPRLQSRVESLEKELSDTKQTLGTAILQLTEKVKKLENKLRKKRKSKEAKDAEGQDQEVPFETDQGDTFATPEKSKVLLQLKLVQVKLNAAEVNTGEGRKKHAELKSKSFEEIQVLYERYKKQDQTFVAIGTEEDERALKKMNEKAIHKEEEKKDESVHEEVKEEEGAKKRKLGTRRKLKAKRRKHASDLTREDDDLKICLHIAPDEDKVIDVESLNQSISPL